MNRFTHSKIFISDNKLNAVKAAFFQPYKEASPAFLIFFHTLSSTNYLAITVFVNTYCHKDAHILKLPAPVTLEVNPVYVDVWIYLNGELRTGLPVNLSCAYAYRFSCKDGFTSKNDPLSFRGTGHIHIYQFFSSSLSALISSRLSLITESFISLT